ncbi:hypothetical protein ACP70R_021429 [Stipagrostis hirtigluma subsp. patula]
MESLLKPTVVAVVVTVVAAMAAAVSYVSTPLTAGFLSSPPFLWVAANVIVLWLLSSSRRCKDNTTSAGDVVLNAVDDLYPSSEYEGSAPTGRRADAPVPRRQGRDREARTGRRADRPRVRKKTAGEEQPRTAAAAEARCGPDDKTRATVATGGEAKNDGGDGDDADVSMDSLWQSIVQRRAARPVAVRKSETWGSDELPRLQRAAETAAARREAMHKSVSAVENKPTAAAAPPLPVPALAAAAAPSAARQLGRRTREVLVMAQDELLRRAESLIRRHHEHLRLQRQESEQRHALELQRHRPAAALIRV